MKKPKKIVILSASFGFGHLSAALSVKEQLEDNLPKGYAKIEVIDFLEFCSSFVNQAITKTYLSSIKYIPYIFTSIFSGTDQKWQTKLINLVSYPLIYNKLLKLLREHDPDLIISTFPLWNYSIRKIWSKIKENPKLLTVITDSQVVHLSWVLEDHSDAYVVTDILTKQKVIELGIKKSKIYPYGFPLRKIFFKDVSRRNTLKSFDLYPNKFTILYFLNNNTTSREYNILKALCKKNLDIQLILLIGEDKDFGKKVQKCRFKFPMKPILWAENISALMQSSDIIITKAGGATTAESIQAGKPILFSQVLPQEEGNVKFMLDNNAGMVIKELSVEKTIKQLEEICSFESKTFKKLQKNAAKLKGSNKTPKIVDLVKKLIEK